MSSKSKPTDPEPSKKSNQSNGHSLFSQKNHSSNLFELKIQQYNHTLESEIEVEKNSKNITKITDALIMLDTLTQIIKKNPFEKWSVEAQKILSSIDDRRAKMLANEIDNAISQSPPQGLQNK